MATRIKEGTCLCKLSTETNTETGEKIYYLSRGTKRFILYDGQLSMNAKVKALMNMCPTEHDNTVEHWVNGEWVK